MNSIVYVGMDVHKESITLCCYTHREDRIQYQQRVDSDHKLVLKYLAQIRKQYPEDTQYVCGYEAGCLGYTLYHQLTAQGVSCIILAPTTMAIRNTKGIKTDKKDAANIAKCLAFHTYSPVHIPTDEDNSIKEYIRMRDDHKKALKVIKQQILALVLRHGCRFETGRSRWTVAHLKWLHSLKLGGAVQESLDEYLITYEYLVNKLERFDKRIEDLAQGERYARKVKRLCCLIGVKTHTALATIVEVGDFERFAKADRFAAYLGLVPGESSSGETQHRGGITKAGNTHVRRLLVEAAQAYARGRIGYKSMALKKRQEGNSPEAIAYADKANERLRRKFYRMVLTNRANRNVAVTAVARELACFIWGLMTDNIA